jgi:ATP-dependent helicase YprA (DUF1998 family)
MSGAKRRAPGSAVFDGGVSRPTASAKRLAAGGNNHRAPSTPQVSAPPPAAAFDTASLDAMPPPPAFDARPDEDEEWLDTIKAQEGGGGPPEPTPSSSSGGRGAGEEDPAAEEEALLEALRGDTAAPGGGAAAEGGSAAGGGEAGGGGEAAGADPIDVKSWFPRLPHAVGGLPARLYPWQAAALAVPGVADGARSLVYAAPTSGGKTLVAEVLMLKAALAGGKVIFVQPFVALVKEKEASMKKLLGPVDKRVAAFYGKHRPHLRFDAAVCTFEKALLLSSLLQQEGRLGDLKLVVVDELHMVRDEYRGYLLEILLTKLRYMRSDAAWGAADAPTLTAGLQVVAMSATVPNLEELASWLDAQVYQTSFRPVTLREYVVVHSRGAGGSAAVASGNGRAQTRPRATARVYQATTQRTERDLELDSSDVAADNFAARPGRASQPFSGDLPAVSCLCREVSCCLVFCAVKKKCEEAAEWIVASARRRAAAAASSGSRPDGPGADEWVDLDGSKLDKTVIGQRQELMEQLSQLPQDPHKLHLLTIPVGVAFHHSGTHPCTAFSAGSHIIHCMQALTRCNINGFDHVLRTVWMQGFRTAKRS